MANQKPITLGHEVAGVITNVGLDITLFCPGHRVAISQICHPVEKRDWTLSIGIGFDGGYAQYAVTPVRRLMQITDSVSFAGGRGDGRSDVVLSCRCGRGRCEVWHNCSRNRTRRTRNAWPRIRTS
ncbi:hypothetical protein FOXG_22743 [Fusarium oxysporum f. sp. lycopersici 4287]|uniref:Alcohol dehydrogenase-like N-terminal domain-containing protein n=1 Tax=Fusarium oxysporum f. sp. lycopersici (strain 4287 / CBS 123668 / FGSC 9935 / NRRL 34936) TaxID=426428 RepID=A0A0J9W9P4_FUSO4|nr:uncharacterized protein FOXG_22743 [Fusarium oxysporum f. sp. lycopersici 4287]KNB20069.1 hypothetical protein FOXG_22743 [Fusarium oxysporum f. sp. lycopersici 4287]